MPKILVVDDDDDIREWIAEILKDAGYRVETLSSSEGVHRLLGLGVIDLALIDHHLPGKSGLSLVRDIHLSNRTTPMIMLTADASQQLAVESFRAGASDFISKPIDPDYLKIIVERTLSTSSKTLKNVSFRALGYAKHKPECSFHENNELCDCGLSELFDDVQGF